MAAEAAATLALAWPLVVTNLAEAALTATDIVFTGWLGSGALAAGALGSAVYFAALIIGLGLMIAVTPLMAAARGEGRMVVRRIRTIYAQGHHLALLLALPLWLMLWNIEPVFLWLGQDPSVSADAALYLKGLMWALLPNWWFFAGRSMTAALERPLSALVVGLAAVPVNALACYVLMHGMWGLPALGLFGIGLGSTVTAILMAAAMFWVAGRVPRFRRLGLLSALATVDLPTLGALLRIGAPIAMLLLLELGIFNAAVVMMGWVGTTALAAHAIAIQLCAFAFMVPLGIAQAATVRVGLAYGAGDLGGIRRAGRVAFLLAVTFMAGVGLVLVSVPEPLIGFFLDRGDPANGPAIELAVGFLVLAAFFQVFDGAQVVLGGMLRGIQDTRVPMLLAALGYWGIGLGLAWVLAFPAGLAGTGVWLGLAAGLASVALLLGWRWQRRLAAGAGLG